VSRVTLLLTGLVALALAPVATLAVVLIIPTFTPALPALYILLCGATAFGPTRVLAGYLAGLGRPGMASTVNLSALVANVALNLVAIPRFGIIGAALAMLVTSVLESTVYSAIAARLSQDRLRAFWLPRVSDIRFILDTARAFAVSLVRRGSSPA
jgi:O-antigen/teichoic acid export membrane protein